MIIAAVTWYILVVFVIVYYLLNVQDHTTLTVHWLYPDITPPSFHTNAVETL